MLSSSFFQVWTAMFYKSLTADWASFRIKDGTTISRTWSSLMNYHRPSEAITINLFSILIILYTFCYLMMKYFRLIDNAHCRSNIISKWSSHSKSRNILLFHPYSKWTHLLSIFISVWENSSTIHLYSHCLSLVFSFMIGWELFMWPLLRFLWIITRRSRK